MPNTFVARSKLHARLVWIAKQLTGHRQVRYFESGKLQRRFHVAWA